MRMIKFCAVVLIIAVAAPCFAVDFIVGAKAGYYVWEPFLKEIEGSGFSEIDRGTGVLYGPVISVLFTPDLTLSLAALTGKQSTHWSSHYDAYDDYYLLATYYFESERTDIDAALSYRIIENFKIFAGYKYQHITSIINYTEVRTDDAKAITELNYSDIEVATPSYGPALGIGYSLPFAERYFIAANLSGLYMQGYLKLLGNTMENYDSSFNYRDRSSSDEIEIKTRQTGLNFEPSIGYSGEGGLIFILGFRYQWLRTEYLEDFLGASMDDANDYLYGAFVSVLYSF